MLKYLVQECTIGDWQVFPSTIRSRKSFFNNGLKRPSLNRTGISLAWREAFRTPFPHRARPSVVTFMSQELQVSSTHVVAFIFPGILLRKQDQCVSVLWRASSLCWILIQCGTCFKQYVPDLSVSCRLIVRGTASLLMLLIFVLKNEGDQVRQELLVHPWSEQIICRGPHSRICVSPRGLEFTIWPFQNYWDWSEETEFNEIAFAFTGTLHSFCISFGLTKSNSQLTKYFVFLHLIFSWWHTSSLTENGDCR